jgi:chemotaxis protein methyltransferase CheR
MKNSLSTAGRFRGDVPPISAEAFEIIRRILKNNKGFSLDSYKDKCIRRRIAIRIRATHCTSAEEYCELLIRDAGELDLLLKVLTIHVSHFFRNPPTFAKLRGEILPYLFARARAEQKAGLNFWSVGCASGEEPYSLALILKESFAADSARIKVSILATDVDEGILETARKGVYGEERLVELTPSLRKHWFVLNGGKQQLVPEIQAMVDFRRGDLLGGSVFPASDLILCRNVLIYFERQEQEKIISGFADALGSGGILVLGKAETLVGASRRRFQAVCPVERIYKAI